MPFLWGALFVSITDAPGPIHHRRNGLLAATAINTLVVSITLGRESIHGVGTIAIAVISLFLLLKWNLNSTWLIIGSGLVGWVMQRIGLA